MVAADIAFHLEDRDILSKLTCMTPCPDLFTLAFLPMLRNLMVKLNIERTVVRRLLHIQEGLHPPYRDQNSNNLT